MAADIKLDRKGIQEILKSPGMRKVIHEVTEKIAADVRSQLDPGTDVVVDDYTTDRAASSVTIRDAAGKLWQVRDGVLTRAAAGQGLEVTER